MDGRGGGSKYVLLLYVLASPTHTALLFRSNQKSPPPHFNIYGREKGALPSPIHYNVNGHGKT
jgi:hypothetical protein